jgi:hypothetical protein
MTILCSLVAMALGVSPQVAQPPLAGEDEETGR